MRGGRIRGEIAAGGKAGIMEMRARATESRFSNIHNV
jgi:hypothetical protein